MIQIVIAEDDFRIANIHEEFLGKITGTKVVGKAVTGEQTLALIEKYKPELLLLDIYLPDYYGLDLIRSVREIHPKFDIIIITAAKESELLEESLRKGITNYLIKPVNLNKFITVMNEYKKQKDTLKQIEYIDQETVDELLSVSDKESQSIKKPLPKGIDKVTLEEILNYMEKENKTWSAEEMGIQVGCSRTTARRYLEYLVSTGRAKVKQEYGIIGRPERRYYFFNFK